MYSESIALAVPWYKGTPATVLARAWPTRNEHDLVWFLRAKGQKCSKEPGATRSRRQQSDAFLLQAGDSLVVVSPHGASIGSEVTRDAGIAQNGKTLTE